MTEVKVTIIENKENGSFSVRCEGSGTGTGGEIRMARKFVTAFKKACADQPHETKLDIDATRPVEEGRDN